MSSKWYIFWIKWNALSSSEHPVPSTRIPSKTINSTTCTCTRTEYILDNANWTRTEEYKGLGIKENLIVIYTLRCCKIPSHIHFRTTFTTSSLSHSVDNTINRASCLFTFGWKIGRKRHYFQTMNFGCWINICWLRTFESKWNCNQRTKKKHVHSNCILCGRFIWHSFHLIGLDWNGMFGQWREMWSKSMAST